MENKKELIEKFLSDKAEESEKKLVESWFENEEEEPELRNFMEEDWKTFYDGKFTDSPEFSHLLDRLHHHIRLRESSKRSSFSYRFLTAATRIAAILFIPLLISATILLVVSRQNSSSEQQYASYQIYAPMGSRVSFELPDNTKGMLNSGSVLSYSVPFTGNREISLKGEAWFEVKHDPEDPFMINAGSSKIRVTGTKFNLSAYTDENYLELVLEEGRVEYFGKEATDPLKLDPSQRIVDRQGEITSEYVDPQKYSAWKEGKLVFKGDPMGEVARRIERWYNVKVILSDPELEKYSFRATFEEDKLEDVMYFLSMTSPIRYKITGKEFLPDGTLSKEIVTIYLK